MGAAPRPQLDHAGAGKLNERFADRRPRYAKARGKLRLVEPLAEPQAAGDDVVLEGLTQIDRRFTTHFYCSPGLIGPKAADSGKSLRIRSISSCIQDY
jgi:hypothetical protein